MIPPLARWLNIKRLFWMTQGLPRSHALVLLENSLDGSKHASMDHSSSHHHVGPLLDYSCHVLMVPLP